jgi:RimJ/RimL family protein N-acetyltransferase
MIVRAAPPEHWCWIMARANLVVTPGFGVVEAIEDLRGAEGPARILGQVAFDGWMPGSVVIHVAIDEPIAVRRLAPLCFGMVFNVFRRGVIIAPIMSTNARSLKFAKNLGFREAFRGRDWYAAGVDMVILEMRRPDCRWVTKKEKEVSKWAA